MVAELDAERKDTWDWEFVHDDWWKTSFRATSWSYKSKPKTKADHPRPPHYHDHLTRGWRKRITADAQAAAGGFTGDLTLNSGLCGVRAVEEVLSRYEVEAAILPSLPSLHPEDHQPPCSEPFPKDVWDDKVQELAGGVLQLGSLPDVASLSPDIMLWDLKALDSPTLTPGCQATIDLTDSDTSVESDRPPSTPKPTKASYARIVSSDVATSPTVLSPLPSKHLSAAALTFIPSTPNCPPSREPITPTLTSSSNSSDSPFSSPTYNFHFPTLNSSSPADRRESRSLPPSLQKDESGFYIEVAEETIPDTTQSLNGTRSTTPRHPYAAVLPSFLTEGSPSPRQRNSKTREMVDRLRSSGSTGRKGRRFNRRESSSDDADEEFSSGSADTKTNGTVTSGGWISAVGNAQISTVFPPTTSQPTKSHKHGHGHKRSSGSGSTSHSTSTSSSTFSPASSTMCLPVPHAPASAPAHLTSIPCVYTGASTMSYPSGPYSGPYTAAPAYMHMRYPPTGRTPWPMGYQPGGYPMYQPFGMLATAVPYGMQPLAPQPAFYDSKGKPVQWYVPPHSKHSGASDRRHAQRAASFSS